MNHFREKKKPILGHFPLIQGLAWCCQCDLLEWELIIHCFSLLLQAF